MKLRQESARECRDDGLLMNVPECAAKHVRMCERGLVVFVEKL